MRHFLNSDNRVNLVYFHNNKHGGFMKSTRKTSESTTSLLSYLTPVLSFFITTKQTEVKEKKHRARTEFSSNHTASLELPDVIIQNECKKIEYKTSTPSSSLFSSLLTTVTSLFKSNTEEKKQEFKPVSKVKAKNVHNKMKSLEEKIKETKSSSQMDELLLEKIELVEDQIIEHAARRVDLFFYLLLAVYKKNMIISKDHTIKQHGKGSKSKGTQACHSSLFPNIKLEPIKTTLSFLFSTKPLVISGTHLEDSLNMTVELPTIVNAFDQRLEGRYKLSKTVNGCLTILNKVSKGEIDPRDGMNEFFKIMDLFFQAFEKKYLTTKNKTSSAAIKTIWKYEKIGTFFYATENNAIQNDYLHLMLRLNSTEINQVTKNPNLIFKFYTRIQDESLLIPKATNSL